MADEQSLSGIMLPTDPLVSTEAVTKNYADNLFSGGVGSSRLSQLTSTVTVTSSTTYVNTSIAFTLPAGQGFALDGYLLYSAATAGDIRFGWTYPTSPWTTAWVLCAPPTTASTAAGTTLDYSHGTLTTGLAGGGVGGLVAATPRGTINTGTSAGTMTLQIAQVTSSTSGTSLSTNSWLRLTRIY